MTTLLDEYSTQLKLIMPSLVCEPVSYYDASNRTLHRKRVTGAEDPKLPPIGGGFAVAFSSLPPADSGCTDGRNALVQMYVAADGAALLSAEAARPSVPCVRLQCGRARAAAKNRIGF